MPLKKRYGGGNRTDGAESALGSREASIAGATALGAGALLARKVPGLKNVLSKAGEAVTGLRHLSFLSGLAAPKSALGNIGAPVIASLERGSLEPVRQFFKPETAQRFTQSLRAGELVGPAAGATEAQAGVRTAAHRLNPFGRVMGAGDVATREALQRAGLSAKEAEALVLQTPLDPNIAQALDNPAARFLFPYRRTPFNFFKEGSSALGRAFEGDPGAARTTAVLGGIGAATGALTEDEGPRAALPIGLVTAFAGKYGLPTAFAAVAARYYLQGRSESEAARAAQGAVSPVSEFGAVRGITRPFEPFDPRESAGYRLYERLTR